MEHFIGCDVHTRYQVVAWIDEETGEIRKRRLEHEGEEVGKFYAQVPRGTVAPRQAIRSSSAMVAAPRLRP